MTRKPLVLSTLTVSSLNGLGQCLFRTLSFGGLQIFTAIGSGGLWGTLLWRGENIRSESLHVPVSRESGSLG